MSLKSLLIVATIQFMVLCSNKLIDTGKLHKIVDERIPNTNYSIYSNQSISLKYDAYPGVFSLHLLKKLGKMDLTYEDQDFESYQQDQEPDQRSGCTAFQRSLQIQSVLSINLPSDSNVFFTDLVALPDLSKAFIVRNDFRIFEVNLINEHGSIHEIISNGQSSNFKTLLTTGEQLISSEFNNPWLFDDPNSNKVFILTGFGALSFDASVDVKDGFTFDIETFKARDNIYDVHYEPQSRYLFIAAGFDGIDVYQIINGKLFLLQTIGEQQLNIVGANIVDVATSEDGKTLYILDSLKGFFIMNIAIIRQPRLSSFNIPIVHASAFDFYKNTFIFIATSVHNQDYAVEVFIDLAKDSYFFNRYYLDETQLFDVVVFDFYAVLVGNDAHKLIFHSIYSGFIDRKTETHSTFALPDLQKVVSFDNYKNISKNQLIGLGRNEFKTFSVNYEHPMIKCHGNNADDQIYLVKMNSTSCGEKQSVEDQSQFTRCNIHHAFFLEVRKPFLLTTSLLWIVIGCVFTFVILFSLLWTLYLCWQKWGSKLKYLDNQLLALKKMEKYEEQHNIQLSENDNNRHEQNDDHEMK